MHPTSREKRTSVIFVFLGTRIESSLPITLLSVIFNIIFQVLSFFSFSNFVCISLLCVLLDLDRNYILWSSPMKYVSQQHAVFSILLKLALFHVRILSSVTRYEFSNTFNLWSSVRVILHHESHAERIYAADCLLAQGQSSTCSVGYSRHKGTDHSPFCIAPVS